MLKFCSELVKLTHSLTLVTSEPLNEGLNSDKFSRWSFDTISCIARLWGVLVQQLHGALPFPPLHFPLPPLSLLFPGPAPLPCLLKVLPKIFLWPHYSGSQELVGPGSLNRLNPGSYATGHNASIAQVDGRPGRWTEILYHHYHASLCRCVIKKSTSLVIILMHWVQVRSIGWLVLLIPVELGNIADP